MWASLVSQGRWSSSNLRPRTKKRWVGRPSRASKSTPSGERPRIMKGARTCSGLRRGGGGDGGGAGGDAEHLIVQPGVDHGLAEAPLVADLDSRDGAFRDELEDGPLI